MLKKYFEPISNDLNHLIKSLSTYQIGKNISFYHSEFPDINKTNIAIIGFGHTSFIFRKCFYQLSYNFKHTYITDFGNLKPNCMNQLNEVVKYCQSNKILPIIISENEITLSLIQKQTQNNLSSLIVVDKKIIQADLNIYQQQNDKDDNNFNISLIGYQSHYTDPKVLNYFTENNFDFLRLGVLKQNLELSEPIIRDADFMSFNLSAVKKIEIPSCSNASSSGFFTEEACQLTYYAGISDKMSLINIHGYNVYNESETQTPDAISQMVWYFIFGYHNRKHDYPVSMNNFREFIIDFKASNYQVTFWKSTKSDRWWMEIPTKENSKIHHRLIPCSYEDYVEAGNGNLPERLLNSIQKFQ